MKDPTQLGPDEWKVWLRDHLQRKGAAALGIDVRHDESPFEKPAALWKAGDGPLRERLLQAVLDFIEESARGEWSPDAFHQLGFLIEACPLPRTETALEDLVQSRRLLKLDAGPQLHMLALRTLLALGWKGSPAFWDSQPHDIKSRWPAIVFEGLAHHDIALAFEALPRLVQTPEAMREVLNLFPGLMRSLHVGLGDLADVSARTLESVEGMPATLLREWFILRGIDLRTRAQAANPSLNSYDSGSRRGYAAATADSLAEGSTGSRIYRVMISGGVPRIVQESNNPHPVSPCELAEIRDALNILIETRGVQKGGCLQ